MTENKNKQQTFGCGECGRRVKVYQDAKVPAIFCLCEDEGPAMQPVEGGDD